MKPRIWIRTLMVAVLICAAAVNVVVQSDRIVFVHFHGIVTSEPAYEPFLSLALFACACCAAPYLVKSRNRKK